MVTPMDRIGRRRVQSCQLDYSTAQRATDRFHHKSSSSSSLSSSNPTTTPPIQINHRGQLIEIEFPMPPQNNF